MNKKQARLRRARRFRAVNQRQNIPRLVVHRTLVHIYAQVVTRKGLDSQVIASASTLDKKLRGSLGESKTKIDQAKLVGETIAERAKQQGVEKVAFDRSGFRYHGRVKALAEGARSGGLIF